MDLEAAEATASPVEQSHDPIRIGIAVSQELAEVVGGAIHTEAGAITKATLLPLKDL